MIFRWLCVINFENIMNSIGAVMVRVLVSSAVDRGFTLQSGQTKDYKIHICCFSTKHTTLRSRSKDWLARNWKNVSECSGMSNAIKIQFTVLVLCRADIIITSSLVCAMIWLNKWSFGIKQYSFTHLRYDVQ